MTTRPEAASYRGRDPSFGVRATLRIGLQVAVGSQAPMTKREESALVHKCARKGVEGSRDQGIECPGNLWNRCNLWMVLFGPWRAWRPWRLTRSLSENPRSPQRNGALVV